jgi:hypothetical protein
MFIITMVSCLVAFTFAGFHDKALFAMGGGILIWILVRNIS